VLRDQALHMMLSEREAAIVVITEGDTSMVPHLSGGDAVLAAPRAARPRQGDLLLYRQRDYWVVHRFLSSTTTRDGGEGLRTRGDGRNALDPCLIPEDVLARVVALRRAGVWRSLAGRPAGVYARLMAWHDLLWAAAGVVAGHFHLGRLVAALDLGVLRLVVPLAFPLFHRRIAPPADSGPDGAV
jgi:hypothetical protein